jgi:hypothetical protein
MVEHAETLCNDARAGISAAPTLRPSAGVGLADDHPTTGGQQ